MPEPDRRFKRGFFELSRQVYGARNRQQRGVALLTVLLITAIVSITAVAMVKSQQIDIRRTANVLENDQAYLLARSIENWAMVVLERDSLKGQSDNLSEAWAQPLVPTAIEGGMVSAAMVDMQGRFNLNNLISQNLNRKSFSLKQFRRLLALCKTDIRLAESVVDWMDDDKVTSTGAAEDDVYWKEGMMYRTANNMMTSVSELLLVSGFDREAYSCLEPALAALPDVESKINVNTAQALVVASLSPNMTFDDAENLVENRGKKGFKDVTEFLAQPALAGSGLTVTEATYLATESSYFMVNAKAVAGHGECTLYSLFNRQNKQARVLGRSIGTY